LTPLHNLERMAVVWSTPNQGRGNKEFEKVGKNEQLFCNNNEDMEYDWSTSKVAGCWVDD